MTGGDEDPVVQATTADIIAEAILDMESLEALVTEVVIAIDRQLAGQGAGRAPSPRLQAALDFAREMIPAIPPQEAPRSPVQ